MCVSYVFFFFGRTNVAKGASDCDNEIILRHAAFDPFCGLLVWMDYVIWNIWSYTERKYTLINCAYFIHLGDNQASVPHLSRQSSICLPFEGYNCPPSVATHSILLLWLKPLHVSKDFYFTVYMQVRRLAKNKKKYNFSTHTHTLTHTEK